jgi:Copper amine oxidase, enzyme domain
MKSAARPRRQPPPPPPQDGGLKVQVEARGPDTATLSATADRLLQHADVRKLFGKTRPRLLAVDLVDPEPEAKQARGRAADPTRFRAVLYDYAAQRTLSIESNLGRVGRIEVTESARQPLPSDEEFRDAVEVLGQDRELGPALRERRLRPYRPVPPLVNTELPDGRQERTIAVGLLPDGDGPRHEIVGVSLASRAVRRFERGAPENARADASLCGQPNSGEPSVRNAAGQVWVTVRQGRTVLWRFLAVRPAASSGTNGSGVELRYVDYRGKRVLWRGHVPILNVKYDGDACGPYRDWQNEEGRIQADGADVAAGFRLCPTPARTILDAGDDTGNFPGVAIYVQGQEVVLVSEMEAGWYRYISEWRLHADGTIRPRFGFSAVTSSCVCNVHHHHVYWRLDFDIRSPGDNVVREFNDPPLAGSSPWHTKSFEIRRPRDPARKRRWRVENASTGEGYEVVPGPDDGVATASPDWPFPRGDVWILRYRGSEIDDGSVATGPPFEAELDRWVNGESVRNTDVVLWYGAHFTHDLRHDAPGQFGHIVGPDLRPVNW